MVEPGVLPPPLEVKPLGRVSPSRFALLEQCRLREIWSNAWHPPLLPQSPAARLGSVIHSILQEAGEGNFPAGNRSTIEARWDVLVEQTEREMRSSWLERSLVPLRQRVRQYQVRRIRTVRKALELAERACPQDRLPPTQTVRLAAPLTERYEVPVQSRDGLIAGRIDILRETPAGTVIADYKTGHILEQDPESGVQAVSATYQTQLKLYAALYADTFGSWPVGLEIIPLQGGPIEIPFTPSESSAILRQAATGLQETNARIAELGAPVSPVAAAEALASPRPSICRTCLFRPLCPAYRRIRDAETGTGWPEDIWGTVSHAQPLGNGRLLITLSVTARPYQHAKISGLQPGPDRHPGLAAAVPGNLVSIYNLKGSDQMGVFDETPFTTVYLHHDGVTA